MGVITNIDFEQYPNQTKYAGQRVLVCFKYDTRRIIPATILRDDAEDPYRTVLRLDDGRIVLGNECQWRNLLDSETDKYPESKHIPVFHGRQETAQYTGHSPC